MLGDGPHGLHDRLGEEVAPPPPLCPPLGVLGADVVAGFGSCSFAPPAGERRALEAKAGVQLTPKPWAARGQRAECRVSMSSVERIRTSDAGPNVKSAHRRRPAGPERTQPPVQPGEAGV